MAVFSELYSQSYASATHTSGGADIFGGDLATAQLKSQYGSANRLVITNVGVEEWAVDLDGNSAKRLAILFGKGSVVINPEDGIFFDTVKLTQLSSGTSNTADVSVRIARAKRVAS